MSLKNIREISIEEKVALLIKALSIDGSPVSEEKIMSTGKRLMSVSDDRIKNAIIQNLEKGKIKGLFFAPRI